MYPRNTHVILLFLVLVLFSYCQNDPAVEENSTVVEAVENDSFGAKVIPDTFPELTGTVADTAVARMYLERASALALKKPYTCKKKR